jgi:L-ascorbate metabolism protein UlaG (beta-lactamase superfamily)
MHPVLPNLRDATVPMPSLKDFLCGGERRVPRGSLPSLSPLEAWAVKPQSGLRVTWLGHSTTLIEIGGVRILTDPVWGPRASPSAIVGPKRFQAVPISLREMPPVDVVIVSHDHYDHLDYPTIRALAKTSVPFVTSLGVGAHLEYWGVPPERIVELDWWESYTLPNTLVVLTAAPSQHFSGRGLKDRNSTLWSSFAMRSPEHSVFFSGDTGLTTEYQSIRKRLGPFDVVMLEIGAFYPAWGDIHLGPDNAVKAHAMLGGHSCLFTGERFHWRCMLGISRRRDCWNSRPIRAHSCSCRYSVNRLSRLMRSSLSLGGVKSTACSSSLHPIWREKSHCLSQCPGRWTDDGHCGSSV